MKNSIKVVKKPTGKVDGSNASVKPVRKPTPFKGGKNPAFKMKRGK